VRLVLLSLGFALLAGVSLAAEPREKPSSFRIYGARTQKENNDLFARVQAIRDELHAKWNGDAKQQVWTPACEIVIHHRESDYLGAVGAGGRGTVGATYIQFDPRQKTVVTRRRIDLLAAGQSDILGALPHEMTHVLLADRYAGSPPPPWLDEGVATLADSLAKQKRHLNDLRLVMARGERMSIAQMLCHDGPIPARQRACFYGQSVALATVLTRLDDPRRIFEFAAAAEKHSVETALRQVYNLELADLDRRITELAFDGEVAQSK
jgi:hypothetical protein